MAASPIDYSELQKEFYATRQPGWDEREFQYDEALKKVIPDYATWHPQKQEEFRRLARLIEDSREKYRNNSVEGLRTVAKAIGVKNHEVSGKNWANILKDYSGKVEQNFAAGPVGAKLARDERAAKETSRGDAYKAEKAKFDAATADATAAKLATGNRGYGLSSTGKKFVDKGLDAELKRNVSSAVANSAGQARAINAGSQITTQGPSLAQLLKANAGRGETLVGNKIQEGGSLKAMFNRLQNLERKGRNVGYLENSGYSAPGSTAGERALDFGLAQTANLDPLRKSLSDASQAVGGNLGKGYTTVSPETAPQAPAPLGTLPTARRGQALPTARRQSLSTGPTPGPQPVAQNPVAQPRGKLPTAPVPTQNDPYRRMPGLRHLFGVR